MSSSEGPHSLLRPSSPSLHLATFHLDGRGLTTAMMASADNVRVAEGDCGMDADAACLNGNLAYFAPSKSIMGLLSNVQRGGDTLS